MRVHSHSYVPVSGWAPELPLPAHDPGREGTVVFVFGGARYFDDAGPIEGLLAAYPGAMIVGCSTAGEIAGRRILDDSLSVAVAQFDRTGLALVTAPVVDQSASREAGKSLARALLRPNLSAVFVLSDGLSVNGSELLRGLHDVLPPSVVVTGGLAADGSRFERTWVLAHGRTVQRTVVALGFYGDAIRVRHGSKGGWDVFGPEREVTRSIGSVLYEVDGRPALDLYETYLGERAAGLPATALLFPLAMRSRERADKTLVRTILAIDREKKSMTFAGDVPEGSRVQLMRANFDRLLLGAAEATRGAAPDPGHESLTIAISCVGRRLILGERTEEEVEGTHDELPPSSTLIGFYSYGEISPSAVGECADLHNQTMTVTSFGEA